jgi:von Willebrand factor type D domain
MRRARFWLLSATSFILTFLFFGLFKRVVSVTLCGVLAMNSGLCVPSLWTETRAIAAQTTPSNQSNAHGIVKTFRQNAAKSPWNVNQTTDRRAVADRLDQLVDQPTLLNQGFLSLCGPAAFFYIWFRNDPVAATRFATELYDTGRSSIGNLQVDAGGSFLIGKSHSVIVQTAKPRVMPLADWMILSALRNSANTVPYTGDPSLFEPLSGGTYLSELETWLVAAGLYENIQKISTTSEDLTTNTEQDIIAILIDTQLISPRGISKHFIVPESKLIVEGNQVQLRYWTWGGILGGNGKLPTTFDRETFKAKVIGALVIKKAPVVRTEPVKKQCDATNSKNDPTCELKSGRSGGDPHLVTFDGLHYDFQTVGEFTLVKSQDAAFEVQVRQVPFNASLSLNRAVAVKLGRDRVAIYAGESTDTTSSADTSSLLRVNGKATTISGDKLSLPDGGEVLKQGSTYVINAASGEKVLVGPSGTANNPFLNISPFVYNRSGGYSGLLGNLNGNPKDDFQMRSGQNTLAARSTYGDVKQVLNQVGLRLPGALDVGEKLYFDQLYKEFGNSWRIQQAASLFDYPSGKTTADYALPGFPAKYLTLNMLSTDQIQQARSACQAANVAPDLLEPCVFDVGFSGVSEFAIATAEISGYVDIVNQLFPRLNVPKPDQLIERVIDRLKPKICLPIVGCL